MARSKTIREDIQPWIDHLIDLYEWTDPERGEETEVGKLEFAHMAVDAWWKLFAELIGWSQAQLIGYSVMANNPKFIELLEKHLEKDLFADSHELEYFGWTYCFNRFGQKESDLQADLDEFMEPAEEGGDPIEDPLNEAGMRTLIAELLMSRCTNNSFWRMPLQSALLGLNYGEVDNLLKPTKKRRQGKPYKMMQWKMKALTHVYFQLGQGVKKYRALENVAGELGQSTETLRGWEKQLFLDPDLSARLDCAQLAGELTDALKAKEWDYQTLEDPLYYGSHRGVNYTVTAKYMLKSLENPDYASLRQSLQESRIK